MTRGGVVEFAASGSMAPVLRAPASGGDVVEWVLKDPERVRTRAVCQPRAASFLQHDHLVGTQVGRVRGDRHVGFIGILARFEQRLDADTMAAAITDFARRHEEIRAFYPLSDDAPQRWVAPADAVEFVTQRGGRATDADATEVRTAPIAVIADEAIEWVCGRASAQARCDLLPGVIFLAVESEWGFTFYYVTDHAHGDAYSLMLACGEIAALYQHRAEGARLDLPPAGAFGDYIGGEQTAAAAVQPDDERIAVWRDALGGRGGRVPGSPLNLGLVDNALQPAVQLGARLLSEAEATRCDARLRGIPVSFTGLLYAALALAERDMTGCTDYFTSTVLSSRMEGHERTQGWLCNFAPLAVRIDTDTTIIDAAHAATASLSLARLAATIPVHAVLAVLLGEGVLRSVDGSPQMVTYIDFRRVPGGDDPTLRSAQLFTAAGRTRNANIWLIRYADEVTLTSQIPDNPTARESMIQFTELVGQYLRKFAVGAHDLCGGAVVSSTSVGSG